MVRLEHVLDTWKTIRQDTAAAVEEFPEADLDFTPAPGCDSFRQIAIHILNAGDGLTGLLMAGEENFADPERRKRMKEYWRGVPAPAGPVELAAALRTSVEERAAALAAQPAEFWSKIITRVDGRQVTRLEMLQFVKEHELTHRSQLFMAMRIKGLVPATTRRRLAMMAAQNKP